MASRRGRREGSQLLVRFHAQAAVLDQNYEQRGNDKALAWLGRPHRIAAPVVAELRAQITSWPMPPATLSPTHGDWQPRNWLIHDGIVSAIDFGRAEMRPALTDFARQASPTRSLQLAFGAGFSGPELQQNRSTVVPSREATTVKSPYCSC
jgi:Ser/Thr protein kinase RdoA (MazF antagonist)